jgi:hypothetical protein
MFCLFSSFKTPQLLKWKYFFKKYLLPFLKVVSSSFSLNYFPYFLKLFFIFSLLSFYQRTPQNSRNMVYWMLLCLLRERLLNLQNDLWWNNISWLITCSSEIKQNQELPESFNVEWEFNESLIFKENDWRNTNILKRNATLKAISSNICHWGRNQNG